MKWMTVSILAVLMFGFSGGEIRAATAKDNLPSITYQGQTYVNEESFGCPVDPNMLPAPELGYQSNLYCLQTDDQPHQVSNCLPSISFAASESIRQILQFVAVKGPRFASDTSDTIVWAFALFDSFTRVKDVTTGVSYLFNLHQVQTFGGTNSTVTTTIQMATDLDLAKATFLEQVTVVETWTVNGDVLDYKLDSSKLLCNGQERPLLITTPGEQVN